MHHATYAAAGGHSPAPGQTQVWDPLVRLFHWSLVAAFATAYAIEEDPLAVHVWAGYAVLGLVAVRLLWGFIGPGHARFSDFVYRPRTLVGYLTDALRGRAPRYIGHSPAGGAMVLACAALASTQVVAAGDPAAGAAAWTKEYPQPGAAPARSCATCHGLDLTEPGRHARTGKPIEALAPSVNPERLTDPAKIEKWLRRNCRWTMDRECTEAEKADFLSFIDKQ